MHVGNGYSKAERMKFAGQNDPNVFFGSYASSVSTVDGISSYFGGKRRTIHLECLRGRTLRWYPQLNQTLPAKVQDNLDGRPDVVAINRELEALAKELDGDETQNHQKVLARRDELYSQKRQLLAQELKNWQEIQPRDSDAVPPAWRPSFFNRIRRLDPQRDRLASSLFLEIPLRSPEGCSVLCDMINLCQENPRVAYRPSLRPEDGRCPVCSKEMDEYASLGPSWGEILTDEPLACRIEIAKRWDHVYRCKMLSLKKEYGFAQLCFQCDEWIAGRERWDEHCEKHVEHLAGLPVQVNPFNFRYTVAAAGQCIFCLFDSDLPAAERFRQFLVKQGWKQHISLHFLELERKRDVQEPDGDSTIPCPDPRCALDFESVQDLRYHCQDAHCVDNLKINTAKRPHLNRQCDDTSASESSDDEPTKFVNETVETLSKTAEYPPGGTTRPEKRSGITRAEERCRSSSTASSAADSITSTSSENLSSFLDQALDEEAVATETSPSSTNDYPDDESYEVERILEHKVVSRGKNKVYIYKVRWVGYG